MPNSYEAELLRLSREPDKALIYLNEVKRQLFEAGQKAERDKRRWIPVAERLPTEKDGDVFCVANKDWVGVITYGCRKVVTQEFFCLDSKKWSDNVDDLPVAWQPFPEVCK